MKKDEATHTHSFGRYLQAIRMEKGISLEAVSEETKIRLETLIQIEEEDHARLPSEVFVKGFLRAYARAIGADGNEAVRLYDSRLGLIKKISSSEADLSHYSRKYWTRLILAIGGVACLIAAVLVILSFTSDKVPAPAPEPAEKIEPVEVEQPQPAPAESPRPTMPLPREERPDKHLLRIETVEETWLKIIIDDQEPSEYRLYPGDHIELKASKGYNILIGNAGGVRLYMNDMPVEVDGESGQVVNIQLP
jgi:cytoskeletal protein RodZ